MPWYWSDDIARVLVGAGKIDATTAGSLISAPVAYRCVADSIDEAISVLQDEDEIPLLAA